MSVYTNLQRVSSWDFSETKRPQRKKALSAKGPLWLMSLLRILQLKIIKREKYTAYSSLQSSFSKPAIVLISRDIVNAGSDSLLVVHSVITFLSTIQNSVIDSKNWTIIEGRTHRFADLLISLLDCISKAFHPFKLSWSSDTLFFPFSIFITCKSIVQLVFLLIDD